MKRLLLILLLMLPCWAIAQTAEDDKGRLTRFIENQLSGVSREVVIEGFEGALSSRATIKRLTVADRLGVWLEMEDLVLDWNRTKVLKGDIDIDELTAGRIALLRNPSAPPSGPSVEATPFALPDLPVSVHIEEVRADQIELDDSFLGEPLTATFQGRATLAAGALDTAFTAGRIDGKEGSFEVEASFDNSSRVLGLVFYAEEGPGGLAVTALGVPDAPAAEVTVTGESPLEDFRAYLTVVTDGIPRLAGTVDYASAPDQPDVKQRMAVDVSGDVTALFAPAYRPFFGEEVTVTAEALRYLDQRLALTGLDISTAALTLRGKAELGADGWLDRVDVTGRLGLDGSAVLLPLGGAPTTVTGGDLSVQFDAAAGDSWTTTTTLSNITRPDLTLSELSLTGGGSIAQPETGTPRWTAVLDYAAKGLAMKDTALAEALGADLTGHLSASGVQGQPTEVQRLTLIGPGLDAGLSATIAGKADGFRTLTQMAVNADDLARFATLSGADLGGSGVLNADAEIWPLKRSFDVTLSGETRDLRVGIAAADPLLVGDGTVALSLRRDETGTRLRDLDLRTDNATVTGVALITRGTSVARLLADIPDTSILPGALSGPAKLALTAQRADNSEAKLRIDADLPSAIARVRAEVSETQAAQLTADVSLADLARYGGLIGRDISGMAEAKLTGTGQLDQGVFDLALTGDMADLGVGIEAADRLLAGAGTVDGGLRRDAEGVIWLDRVRLVTPELDTVLDGQLSVTGSDLDFDATIADASVLGPGLSGALTAKGRARGDENGTDVSLVANGTGIDVTATADMPPPGDRRPIAVDAEFALAKLSRFRELVGRPISGSATGDLTASYAADTKAFDAKVTAITQSLAIGIDPLDNLMNGKATLTADLARDARKALTLNSLTMDTPQAMLEAAGKLTKLGPQGQASAQVFDLAKVLPDLSGPATLSLSAAEPGPDGHTPFTLQATAPATRASASGSIATAAEQYRTTFDADLSIERLSAYRRLVGQPLSGAVTARLSGSAAPQTGAVTTDVTVTSQSLGIGADAVDKLLAGRGQITGQLTRRGDGSLRFDGVNADWPNLSARLNGGRSTTGALSADLNARLADLGVLTNQIKGPLTLAGTAEAQANGTTRVDLTANGPGGSTARTTGAILKGGTLDMNVTGSLPLALANGALSPESISGTANLDLKLTGKPGLEAVSGRITTDGSRLSLPRFRATISDLTGAVLLDRGQMSVDLRGSPPKGGTLTVNGPLSLMGDRPADLTFTAQGLSLSDPRLYETTVDGRLTMTGPLRGGAKISGGLSLGRTEVRIPSSTIGALGPLPEVRHLGASKPVETTLERAGLTLAGIAARRGGNSQTGSGARDKSDFPLDVTVRAPARIFLRGRGLDAELGGSIKLGGSTDNILPSGRFELIRGRIDILQQRFDLDEGYATLEGDFSPYLYLVASTDTDSGTAFITVEGDATEPSISFSSVPELPQDEVLARLIFGRDISSISPLQAVQLAAAINTLAGRGDGGIVNKLRLSTGLDDLDITTAEDGTTALRAGKYLTENLYTDVEVDSEGKTSIDLNLDVTDEVTVRGRTNTLGESSIGVFFEKDY